MDRTRGLIPAGLVQLPIRSTPLGRTSAASSSVQLDSTFRRREVCQRHPTQLALRLDLFDLELFSPSLYLGVRDVLDRSSGDSMDTGGGQGWF